MLIQITKKFTFDCAHYLTDYHGKCEEPHGHTYRLYVTMEGNLQKNGLVMDFVLLRKIVEKEVLAQLDHQDLNKIFKNPSCENIAVWIFERLKKSKLIPKTIRLVEVKLWESDTSAVTFRED